MFQKIPVNKADSAMIETWELELTLQQNLAEPKNRVAD